jgi:hypothetical protein
MPETSGDRIRVVLRSLTILDKLEPFFKETGEFVFKSTVTADTSEGEVTNELRIPEEGHWSISDHPRWNTVKHINKVLFEGEVGSRLVVELRGEELDQMSANDQLETYRRVFDGPPDSWIGRYQPRDEGGEDPEVMSNWRIAYDIERA